MQYTFQYHSNGSCLLTGEYLVSKGSQAISADHLERKQTGTGGIFCPAQFTNPVPLG